MSTDDLRNRLTVAFMQHVDPDNETHRHSAETFLHGMKLADVALAVLAAPALVGPRGAPEGPAETGAGDELSGLTSEHRRPGPGAGRALRPRAGRARPRARADHVVMGEAGARWPDVYELAQAMRAEEVARYGESGQAPASDEAYRPTDGGGGERQHCEAHIWPSWANSWVTCGSTIRGDGRCFHYGHAAPSGAEDEAAGGGGGEG